MWEKRLKELILQGCSLTEIGRELQVKNKTIKRYAEILRIPVEWKADKSRAKNYTDRKKQFQETLILKREQWLKELNEKDDIKNYNLYYWLFKNDKDWLKQNMFETTSKSTKKQRKNWEDEDQRILKKIKSLINNWDIFEEEKPRRITKTFIIETLGENLAAQKNI